MSCSSKNIEITIPTIPGFNSSLPNTYDKFKYLTDNSDHIQIATGYISTASIQHLDYLIDDPKKRKWDILIGMHFFEGFTQSQFQAASDLQSHLQKNHKGIIKVASLVPFHGKIYFFSNGEKAIGAIIGSMNLSGMVPRPKRQFETSVILNNPDTLVEMGNFMNQIFSFGALPINEIKEPKIIEGTDIFRDTASVKKVSNIELAHYISQQNNSSKIFHLPLKSATKSNLNASFGKGRLNTSNNRELMRHWYEVEIIVPKDVTSQPGYPKNMEFEVITDDGYKFRCKTSGDYSKNFRSARGDDGEGNLRVLGRWIKDRLVGSGALRFGDLVTDEVLEKYGRTNITLTQLEEGIWFLDFSRPGKH